MLLEDWNPFPVDEGSRGSRDHEEKATQNVRTWGCLRLPKRRASWLLVEEWSGTIILRGFGVRNTQQFSVVSWLVCLITVTVVG